MTSLDDGKTISSDTHQAALPSSVIEPKQHHKECSPGFV
jgi:hypothetical protein